MGFFIEREPSGGRGRKLRALIGATLVVSVLMLSWHVSAQSASERVVAVVGDMKITVADVEAGLKRLPRYQLRTLAKDANGIKRAYLGELIKAALFAQSAKDKGLAEQPDVRERIMSVLVSVVRSDLRDAVAASVDISDKDVADYYNAHLDSYASQVRLKLWRIQLRSKAEAQRALELITKDPKFAKEPTKVWGDFARAHSLDKTSAMRNGALGFVLPSGATAHKDLRVDPALYQAALTVKDGEMVPEPVADGRGWSLVQRRGTMETPERSLALETASIRALLSKQALRSRVSVAIEKLRKKNVTIWQPEVIEQITGTRVGDIVKRKRKGTLPSRQKKHPTGQARPHGAPGQLR